MAMCLAIAHRTTSKYPQQDTGAGDEQRRVFCEEREQARCTFLNGYWFI
jgi:hypothetical protein